MFLISNNKTNNKVFLSTQAQVASLSTKLTTIYISYALYMYHKKKKSKLYQKRKLNYKNKLLLMFEFNHPIS